MTEQRLTVNEYTTCISVLLDFLETVSPGEILTYASLKEVLEAAFDRSFTHGQIIAAINRVRPLLLSRHRRTLVNAPRVGYRLAVAAEHRVLAHRYKLRADGQLNQALGLLRHVRYEDLTPAQWQQHSATLQAMEALKQRMEGYERRQARQEAAIANFLRQAQSNEAPPA